MSGNSGDDDDNIPGDDDGDDDDDNLLGDDDVDDDVGMSDVCNISFSGIDDVDSGSIMLF